MRVRKTFYFISTGIIVLVVGLGSFLDLAQTELVMESARKFLLPNYWVPFLGIMKLAGTIAILQNKFLKLREAAYAGITFYFIGALYSHVMIGDALVDHLLPVLILISTVISYLNK